MKRESTRSVYKLGFVDVLHKEKNKRIAVSKKVFANKALMGHLGYEEIVEPEKPVISPVMEVVEPEVKVINPRKKRGTNKKK